jgi:DNA-binding transcriptional LysR family regulator
VRTDDAEQIRGAVLAGLGIAQAPNWLFHEEFASGAVRRILRNHEPAAVPISAVRPESRRLAGKVAVFIEFLAELWAEQPN